MKILIIFVVFIQWIISMHFSSRSAFAQEAENQKFSFGQIWTLVLKSDPLLKAVSEEQEAARLASERAARHWYPHLYASGRAFSTNDPVTNFMFGLQQRQILANDFSPTLLNSPGVHFFGQGTLGVDFPLFEGGMKIAQARVSNSGAEAKMWESKAQGALEYARLAEAYAGLLALSEEQKQLQELQGNIQNLLDHYSIGAKSNPVGYSGLLGLRNLKNRVEALLVQNVASARVKRSSIEAAARELPAAWNPKIDRAHEFLVQVFPHLNSPTEEAVPASVRAARLGAESLEAAKGIERARLLPRVGTFVQSEVYSGSRGSASSYSGGAYFQWDLFSAGNLGAVAEAEHRAAAAAARADALELKMRADRGASLEGMAAAEKTLKILDESAELLSEQTQMARQLFRNGSINALQLIEVLNRRADLLGHRREAELMLAQTKAAFFITSESEGVLK